MPSLPELQFVSPGDYLRAPIPMPDDEIIRSYVNGLCDALKDWCRPALSSREAWFLIIFAERMAALAVREKSLKLVRDGLLALAIEDGQEELPESIGAAAVLWDAATRVSSDPRGVFAAIFSNLPESEFVKSMRQFLRRPHDEQSLDAWGYRVRTENDQFRYWRWGRPDR
jgi:hypothetical protein